MEDSAVSYTAGIPSIDVPIYLKRIPYEVTWLAEQLDTTPEIIQSINDFGADYERAILAATLYYGAVDIENLKRQKQQQEEANDRFYRVYNTSTSEPEREAAWQCCQKYQSKARELEREIGEQERLNTQRTKLVERYQSRLENAVDAELVKAYHALNELGKKEALKRVQELGEIGRYKT